MPSTALLGLCKSPDCKLLHPKTKGAEEFIAKVLVITVSKDMKSEM
jgi:hypothetical protein